MKRAVTLLYLLLGFASGQYNDFPNGIYVDKDTGEILILESENKGPTIYYANGRGGLRIKLELIRKIKVSEPMVVCRYEVRFRGSPKIYLLDCIAACGAYIRCLNPDGIEQAFAGSIEDIKDVSDGWIVSLLCPNSLLGISVSQNAVLYTTIQNGELEIYYGERGQAFWPIRFEEKLSNPLRYKLEGKQTYISWSNYHGGLIYITLTKGNVKEDFLWFQEDESGNALDHSPDFYLSLWKKERG